MMFGHGAHLQRARFVLYFNVKNLGCGDFVIPRVITVRLAFVSERVAFQWWKSVPLHQQVVVSVRASRTSPRVLLVLWMNGVRTLIVAEAAVPHVLISDWH